MPLTKKVPDWKKEEIEEIEKLIDEYESVGVVDMTEIPSKQLQQIRSNLRGSAVLRMGRNTLIKRALESKDLDSLLDSVNGEVGLIFTDDDPFDLYRKLQEGKSPAPLKRGQEAPEDIVIPEGDTGADPGPFLGDLQEVGANARIDEGSIVVASDSVVLKEGEKADSKIVEVLDKLEIYPVEVGLDLIVLNQQGTLFTPEELDIDIDEYEDRLQKAVSRVYNLSVNANIVTPSTIDSILSKAVGEALNVGIEAEVYEQKVIDKLLSKAQGRVESLAPNLDEEALPEDFDIETETQQETSQEPVEEAEEEEEKDEEQAEEAEEKEEESGEAEEKAAEGLDEMF